MCILCGFSAVSLTIYLFVCFLKRLYLFLEREEGREKVRKRNTDQLPLIHSLTRDQAHNPGVCPDQESNLRPFALWADAQPTEPHVSELVSLLKLFLLLCLSLFFADGIWFSNNELEWYPSTEACVFVCVCVCVRLPFCISGVNVSFGLYRCVFHCLPNSSCTYFWNSTGNYLGNLHLFLLDSNPHEGRTVILVLYL